MSGIDDVLARAAEYGIDIDARPRASFPPAAARALTAACTAVAAVAFWAGFTITSRIIERTRR